jgi:hypothetical protein
MRVCKNNWPIKMSTSAQKIQRQHETYMTQTMFQLLIQILQSHTPGNIYKTHIRVCQNKVKMQRKIQPDSDGGGAGCVSPVLVGVGVLQMSGNESSPRLSKAIT